MDDKTTLTAIFTVYLVNVTIILKGMLTKLTS